MITARAGEKRGRNEGKTRRRRAKEARRTPEAAGGNSSAPAGRREEKAGGRRACPKEAGTPLSTWPQGVLQAGSSGCLARSHRSTGHAFLGDDLPRGNGRIGIRTLDDSLPFRKNVLPPTATGWIVFSPRKTLELISFANFLGFFKPVRSQKLSRCFLKYL